MHFHYLKHDDEDERRKTDRNLQQVGPQSMDRISSVSFWERDFFYLSDMRYL